MNVYVYVSSLFTHLPNGNESTVELTELRVFAQNFKHKAGTLWLPNGSEFSWNFAVFLFCFIFASKLVSVSAVASANILLTPPVTPSPYLALLAKSEWNLHKIFATHGKGSRTDTKDREKKHSNRWYPRMKFTLLKIIYIKYKIK